MHLKDLRVGYDKQLKASVQVNAYASKTDKMTAILIGSLERLPSADFSVQD